MITAAVFPELVAGRYWVLDSDGHDVRPVVIGGGELTEIDLRGSVTVFSRDTDTVTDPGQYGWWWGWWRTQRRSADRRSVVDDPGWVRILAAPTRPGSRCAAFGHGRGGTVDDW